jgi:hypothetical protein
LCENVTLLLRSPPLLKVLVRLSLYYWHGSERLEYTWANRWALFAGVRSVNGQSMDWPGSASGANAVRQGGREHGHFVLHYGCLPAHELRVGADASFSGSQHCDPARLDANCQ